MNARVGIDIGGTSVKCVRLTGAGHIDARRTHDGASLASLTEAIRAGYREIGAGPADPVAVCLPGLVSPETGVLERSANLSHLVGHPPAAIVGTATGVHPSAVLTDAAAWGRGVWTVERTPGRLLVVAMGTGIGGAFLVNGEPVTLDGITPGHLGMLDVSLGEADPPRAGDGTPGVLEAYAGGRALLARFGRDGIEDAVTRLDEHDRAIRALARALRICHAIYKPDAIRLCGGLGALLAPKIPLIDQLVRTDLTSVARPGWTLASIADPFLAAQGAAESLA